MVVMDNVVLVLIFSRGKLLRRREDGRACSGSCTAKVAVSSGEEVITMRQSDWPG
jgi:hypothetical protein